MRVALLVFTLLICHHALALPPPSVERSELHAYPNSSIEVQYEITPQALDSRSPNHDKVITDLDAYNLQPRPLAWASTPLTSTPLYITVSVLLDTATATALQLANGWLTWRFSIIYDQLSNSCSGAVYSTTEESASDRRVYVTEYIQESYSNTDGVIWSEGTMLLEARWRSISLRKSVIIFWRANVRFYQTTTIGVPISSTMLGLIGNAWGYQLQYNSAWDCAILVQDRLDILQTVFESCNEGQSSSN